MCEEPRRSVGRSEQLKDCGDEELPRWTSRAKSDESELQGPKMDVRNPTWLKAFNGSKAPRCANWDVKSGDPHLKGLRGKRDESKVTVPKTDSLRAPVSRLICP